MADYTKTVEIVFAGVNNVGQSIDGIGSDLSKLGGTIGSVTGPLADLSVGLLKTEAAILATGAAMVGLAVNQAGQFEQSIIEIGTLFNGTSDDVDVLSDSILEYAKTSTASIDEINASVYQAISTGTDWADSVKLVSDAEVLATAGRADLNAVTTLLTSSLNAYGRSTAEAGDFSDVLFTAVQKGATTIPELASSLGQVTSIASAAGVPFDELVGTLAALTTTQGTTAESATKLKRLLAELLDPTDELKAAMGGTSLETDGLQAVMIKLQEATGGNAEEFFKLFGSVQSVQAAIALANDGSGIFNSTLEAMENRTGNAAAAAEALGDSFENVNQTLLNNIKATLIELGGPLLDEYGENIKAITGIFQGVQIAFDNEAFAPIFAALEALGQDSAEYLNGIAEALPAALSGIDWGPLITGLDDLRDNFGNLFGDLDLTDAADLEKVIQFLVNGFTKLTEVSANLIERLTPLATTLGGFANDILSMSEETSSFIGTVLGIATVLNLTLVPALNLAGSAFRGIADVVLLLAGAKYLGGLGATIAGVVKVIGAGGLITAVVAANAVIASWLIDVAQLSDEMDKMKQNTQNSITAWDKANGSWEQYVVNLNAMGESVTHLNAVFKDQYGVTADQVAQYGSVEAALAAVNTETIELTDQIANQVKAEKEALIASGELSDGYDLLVKQQLARSEGSLSELDSNEALVRSYQQMTTAQFLALDSEEKLAIQRAFGVDVITGTVEKTEELTKAQNDAQLTSKELSDQYLAELAIMKDFELGLESLASAERMQAFELAVEFNLAELEAETERAQVIIENIGTTVTSTGELIGELFALFTDENLGFLDKLKIEDQIDLENERRQQALDDQTRLADAQIALMEAQVANLESGEALINIQADGLEPEIRAFMYRILDNIRVEMSRDQLAFITGV